MRTNRKEVVSMGDGTDEEDKWYAGYFDDKMEEFRDK